MRNSSFIWALALSIGILSCSEPTKPGDAPVKPDEKARKLTVFTWGEYVSPSAVEKFTERTGIGVEIVEFHSSAEMIAAMHSNPEAYDVITVDDSGLQQMRDLSLLSEIDRRRLKNFGNLDPQFLGLDCDPENRFSVPYLIGATIIAYRKDKVGDLKESWNSLFDPRWDGRVALLDEYTDVLAAGLLSEGYSGASADAVQIGEARDKILRQIHDRDTSYGTFEDVLGALDRGDIWVAMNYNGDTALAAETNPNIDFLVPDEGAILWLDHLVISRDTGDIEAAHRFLDFMLEGEIAAETANAFNLSSPNLAAAAHIDEEIISDPRIYLPEDLLSKSEYLYSRDGKTAHLISRTEREISDALRASGSDLSPPEGEPQDELTGAVQH